MDKDYTEIRTYVPNSGNPVSQNGVPSSTLPQQGSATYFRSRDNKLWTYRRVSVARQSKVIRHIFNYADIGNDAFRKEQTRRIPSQSYVQINRQALGSTWSYNGATCINASMSTLKGLLTRNLTWETFAESDIALFSRGASIINATLPNKEQMNIALSLAELKREGLPSFRTIHEFIKNPGSGYLNIEFGIAPIARDIVTLATLVPKAADIIRRFENMRGREYRRRRNVLFELSHDSYQHPTIAGAYPPAAGLYSAGNGAARPVVTRKFSDHIWFSGAYRVATLDDSTLLGKLAEWESEANHLLGIRITPEVVYNLLPYSWLLDWFVTIGDVISNYSHIGLDGVALRYGYLMRTTEVEAEVTLPGVVISGKELTDKVFLTRKSRVKATPYGFGFTAADMSPKQWAILGALGLSKAQGVF